MHPLMYTRMVSSFIACQILRRIRRNASPKWVVNGMNSNWNIEDITKQSLLYDYYGQLLTKRQQQVYELYHGENLSLAEIAEELEISRQGVHDALKSAGRSLDGYEEKLGLVQRFLRTDAAIEQIDREILEILEILDTITQMRDAEARPESDTEDLIRRLKKVKSIIDRLEE